MSPPSLPSFCLTADIDVTAFLSHVSGIFALRKEPALPKIDLFLRYFQQIQNAQSLDDLVGIDPQRAAADICEENRVHPKAYLLKSKLRALFISVFVQRRLFFLARENAQTFFALAAKELFSALPLPSGKNRLHREEIASLVKFYVVMREIQRWKPRDRRKWQKFAMYAASFATGEGIWYCPGGGATPRTTRRVNIFKLFFARPAAGQQPAAALWTWTVSKTKSKTETKLETETKTETKTETTLRIKIKREPNFTPVSAVNVESSSSSSSSSCEQQQVAARRKRPRTAFVVVSPQRPLSIRLTTAKRTRFGASNATCAVVSSGVEYEDEEDDFFDKMVDLVHHLETFDGFVFA